MKNKKMFLLIVLILTAIITIYAQTATDFNVTFTKDEKGVVITGYTGTATAVRIPATIEGMPVREIGEGAFWDKNITSVVIPEGITIIRKKAFNGITISAFNRLQTTDKLVQVTLPSTLQIIEDGAFNGNAALKSIVIPNGVTLIGSEAFANCSSLASVTLPKNLVDLGNGAFAQTAITSITLPTNLTRIEGGAFYKTKLTSIVIPEGVTEIARDGYGCGAFANCVALTSVTFPSTIKKIGGDAFNNCSSLTTVTIPESVEAIDIGGAFDNCVKLSLVSQMAIKKRREAWVAAQEAAREAELAALRAQEEAREAEREADRKQQEEAREAEREAVRKQQEALNAQYAAASQREAEAKPLYNNLSKKAGVLIGKIRSYRAYSNSEAKKIIRDAAKEYVALLSEVADFKNQYPEIKEQSLDYYESLSENLGRISGSFYSVDIMDALFNKKELDAFRKEFPSIFD